MPPSPLGLSLPMLARFGRSKKLNVPSKTKTKFPASLPPSLPPFHCSLTPSEQTRPSTLNRLHLRIAKHRPPEPLRQLVAIPELALLRRHAAELAPAAASDRAVGLAGCCGRSLCAAVVAAAHHGAVLGGFLAVGGEGLGEGFGGRGGVDLGGVVDF